MTKEDILNAIDKALSEYPLLKEFVKEVVREKLFCN